MRYVHFDPAELTGDKKDWWERWSARAEAARSKAYDDVKAGRKPKLNPAIWSDLKTWLNENVFYGKCAYCEARFDNVDWGDAEHHRPKGKVIVKNPDTGKSHVVQIDGEDHPGYWWLAYDWQNLIPACSRCNSGNAKGAQFPVKKTHVGGPYDGPNVETLNRLEEPLILHPYDPDTSKYLTFGEQGEVVATDGNLKGKTSIKVMMLDRAGLNTDRKERQEQSEDRLLRIVVKVMEGARFSEEVEKYITPRSEYTQAISAYFRVRRELIRKNLNS